jgi:hypothetical protein
LEANLSNLRFFSWLSFLLLSAIAEYTLGWVFGSVKIRMNENDMALAFGEFIIYDRGRH